MINLTFLTHYLSRNPDIFSFYSFPYYFCLYLSCSTSYWMSWGSLGSIFTASVMSWMALSKSFLFS